MSEHPVRWVELTPDYRCNNRCIGCFSVDDDGASMSTREAFARLARGRTTGATWLWLGGGEPTIRKDLFPIVREARRLGYDRIRLQTNGMMLSYEAFAERAVAEGVTEVSLSIKGATAATHDAYTRTPGTFDLMVRGAENARSRGITLEGDVLVYASNAGELPVIVKTFHALGVERFRLWLLSSAGSSDPAVRAEVPRIAEVMPHIVAAMDLGLSDDPEFIVSLHTPACTIPETHRRAHFDAAAYGLLVVNPGGHSFMLETSPMEGGTYLPGCAACAYRDRCAGLRRDYLEAYTGAEFRAV